MRTSLAFLLLLAACTPSLNDDDDVAGDDDDVAGDDDDATDDDDASTDDDDDASTDDDDVLPDDDDFVPDDDDDDDLAPCMDDVTVLDPADVSALGFSAADVMGPIEGPLTASGEWTASGVPTQVTFAVAMDGAPLFHDLSMPPNPPPNGPDYQCLDWLEVPVAVDFSSADGAFAETIASGLRVMEWGGPWLDAELDWQNLAGTFVWTEIDPAEWDQVGLSLSNGWDGSVMTGQVSMYASRELPSGIGEGMVGPVLLW